MVLNIHPKIREKNMRFQISHIGQIGVYSLAIYGVVSLAASTFAYIETTKCSAFTTSYAAAEASKNEKVIRAYEMLQNGPILSLGDIFSKDELEKAMTENKTRREEAKKMISITHFITPWDSNAKAANESLAQSVGKEDAMIAVVTKFASAGSVELRKRDTNASKLHD